MKVATKFMLNFNDFFFVNSEIYRHVHPDIISSIKSLTYDGTRKIIGWETDISDPLYDYFEEYLFLSSQEKYQI